jgi:hypothetical protein
VYQPPAPPLEEPIKESSWLPVYADALGVEPMDGPQRGQVVENVRAEVVDPVKLEEFGFSGIKKGHQVVLVNLGNGRWRIRPIATREDLAVDLWKRFGAKGNEKNGGSGSGPEN